MFMKVIEEKSLIPLNNDLINVILMALQALICDMLMFKLYETEQKLYLKTVNSGMNCVLPADIKANYG